MSDTSNRRAPWPVGRALLGRAGLVAATALVLAVVAPLRTSDLAWLPRLTLFLLATLGWEGATIAASAWFERWRPGVSATAPGFAAILFAASLPATGLVVAGRAAAGDAIGNLPLVYAESLVLGLLVGFARRGLRRRSGTVSSAIPAAPEVAPRDGGAAFLRRHAPTLTGRLLALQAEDHYLRIHSETGSALVLMRLRDAMAELGHAAGWQPHRSYWLAADAGGQAVRRGQAWRIELPCGLQIPVSKAATPAMRNAGYGGVP